MPRSGCHPGHRGLSVGVHHPGEPGGARTPAGAPPGRPRTIVEGVHGRDVLEHPRLELDTRVGVPRPNADPDLVTGATVGVVEHRARCTAPGQQAQVRGSRRLVANRRSESPQGDGRRGRSSGSQLGPVRSTSGGHPRVSTRRPARPEDRPRHRMPDLRPRRLSRRVGGVSDAATTVAYPIRTRTLANGLRVVVSEDHAVPTVTVNLWVGAGSRNEPPGRTGFAHLFEHMMFQGSAHVRRRALQALERGRRHRINGTTGSTARTTSRPCRPTARRWRSGSRRTAWATCSGPRPGEARQPARRREERAPAEHREPALRADWETSARPTSRRTTPTTTRSSARWRTSTPRASRTWTLLPPALAGRATPC